MKTIISISAVKERIEQITSRSAWNRGVKTYAIDMVEEIAGENETGTLKLEDGRVKGGYLITVLHQTFDMWVSTSRGGVFDFCLIYDRDIAERLCSPSELKKTRNGEINPSRRETWLDCQGRALYQAALMVKQAIQDEFAA